MDALDLIEVTVQFFASHEFSFPVKVVDEMFQPIQAGVFTPVFVRQSDWV